ncbi:hypothetical protein ES705_09410 [subsurface metagenome]
MSSKRKKVVSVGPAETVKWANDPESLGKVRSLFPGGSEYDVGANYKYGELSIKTASGVVLAHTGDRVGRRETGEPYIIKGRKEKV